MMAREDAADRITGEQLYEEMRIEAARRGITLNRMVKPMWGKDVNWRIEQLRIATRPTPATIEKVRSLIAGSYRPVGRRAAHPNQMVRRVDREASGLPPSRRELAEVDKVERDRLQREREDAAKAAAIAAQSSRQPGETLAEAVRREALAAGQRRRAAGVAGGGSQQSLASVEGDMEDDEGVGEVTAERRQRELRDVASPSALIRRATAEWPDKCNKVAGLAARMGVQLGEAWQRVIDAGVMTVSEDLREEGA